LLKRIRSAGQWLFLRVEALFNLAFGDRLNPLYYLGPISYFLIWLVVASGLGIGTLFTLFVVPAVYLLIARDHATAPALVPEA